MKTRSGFITANERQEANPALFVKSAGFTLVELLVVITIIGLLSGIVLASLSAARQDGRDAQRLQDMARIQSALELYYLDNGHFPQENSSNGSWEISNEDSGQFLDVLVDRGYLNDYVVDPVNEGGDVYMYYQYGAGGGCSQADYYVLGIENMETSGRPHPDSPGWICGSGDDTAGNRTWNNEFDWVTGAFE